MKVRIFFTVFDFGGNVDRLGNYDDNREWSLWHEAKKSGGGVPPLKECGITSSGNFAPKSIRLEKSSSEHKTSSPSPVEQKRLKNQP